MSHRYIFDPAGPWKINILTMVPSRADLVITTARALDSYFGRERTSSMARRSSDSLSTVIAALNADFFEKTGENYNNQIISGEVVKGRPPVDCSGTKLRKNRSQFAITESGQPLIERFAFDGHLFWGDGSVTRIGGVNTVATEDSVALFTHRYNERIPVIGDRSRFSASIFLATRKDTLLYLVTKTGTLHDSTFVGSTGCIVVNYGAPSRDFSTSPGDTMRILFRFPPANERLVELVGGFPQIVRGQR
ncbi:MAG: hypothetical protein OEM41_04525, partial [Ignavibacteria bacterium]|nr:hypothetical protein [Ignavibacteria bacterium]